VNIAAIRVDGQYRRCHFDATEKEIAALISMRVPMGFLEAQITGAEL